MGLMVITVTADSSTCRCQRPPRGAFFEPDICMAESSSETAACGNITNKTECVRGTCSSSDAKYQDQCAKITDSADCKTQIVCAWTAAHPCSWGPVSCKESKDCSKYESLGPGPCYCIPSEQGIVV